MNYEDHINNELQDHINNELHEWITKITGTINYEDHINNELRRSHEQWITKIT